MAEFKIKGRPDPIVLPDQLKTGESLTVLQEMSDVEAEALFKIALGEVPMQRHFPLLHKLLKLIGGPDIDFESVTWREIQGLYLHVVLLMAGAELTGQEVIDELLESGLDSGPTPKNRKNKSRKPVETA